MDIQNELEKRRKECLTLTAIFFAVLTVGLLSFLILGIVALIVVILDVVFYFIFVNKKDKEYKRFYKEHVVKAVLEEYIDDLVFDPKGGIKKEVIAGTEMMMMGNTYSSNDYIAGRYKDIYFEQADVEIQDVHNNGKNTTTVTYFKGRWMIFEFNKRFAYDMQIKEKSFSYSKRKNKLFGPKEERFKKIDFEDSSFNSVFTTYARNEHEAYYIVTPHFMQNLMEFNNAVPGNMLLCFVDSKLHLALNNNKDAFEPSVFKKTDLARERQSITDDLSIIMKFVEGLKLDNNLFA